MYAVAFQPTAPEPLIKMMGDYLCSMAPALEGQFVLSKTAERHQGFLDLELVHSKDRPTMKVWVPMQYILAVLELGEDQLPGFHEICARRGLLATPP